MSTSANSTAIGEDSGSTGPGDGHDFELAFVFAGYVDAQRLAIAFLTWVVWDLLITADDMIELFWNAKWTIAKVVYVINFYAALITTIAILLMLAMPFPTDVLCNVVPWIELAGSAVLLALIGFAMIIRVYALWNRDKRILTTVLTLCCLHIVCYIIIIGYAYGKGSMMAATPPFTGCVIVFGFTTIWPIFIPSLVFETVIASLIIYKTWYFATREHSRTPLYTTLFQDGLIYYIAIILSQVLALVCFQVPSTLTIPVLRSYSTFPVAAVACNRLFIRLQRLLVSKSKGQSGFSTADFWTEDFWSSVAPELTYGSSGTDSEANTRLPHRPTAHPTRVGTATNDGFTHIHNSKDLDYEIGMEPLRR
ncbi:hypothetical protein M408DRAFT_241167 [Serendipita vermifera MAFF 305830]|uniref:DUF6533 domain-containing protein n=1 Tax=Serendipita vermifera MAFF 305830 TaxID=933852 RepID=A0A0C3BII1_SERVB|nr:hypothetical protein M408DRAFT_241167 [Serendipita vermifera MAFF 305830]